MPTEERENAIEGLSPTAPAVSKSSHSGEASKLPSVIAGLLQSTRSYGPTDGPPRRAVSVMANRNRREGVLPGKPRREGSVCRTAIEV